jgi:hypothetical protein
MALYMLLYSALFKWHNVYNFFSIYLKRNALFVVCFLEKTAGEAALAADIFLDLDL